MFSVEKTVFMKNKSRSSIIFLSTIRKFYQQILMQRWGERTFLKRLGMRVYIRIAMITVRIVNTATSTKSSC